MADTYIKVSAIYRKLKQAQTEHCALYIHAPAGYGKTAAVQYYLRNKTCLLLNGQTGSLDKMPPIETINESIVAIDDISWITDEKSISYIINLVKDEKKQVFLIGRSKLPLWLKSSCLDIRILQADGQDLRLGSDQIKKLLTAHKITITPEELADILRDTNGYATAVKLLAYRMSDGKHYGVDVKEETQEDLFHYYDTAFYEKWDYEMKRQILQLAAFGTFTLRMAEMVTGCTNARLFLEKTATVGDFITGNGQGEYTLHPSLKKYLLWKQEKEFTEEQRNNIYYNAGLYYELADDIQQALHHYAKANSQSKIAELLIKNAMKHPGNGHYFETRNYYLALPTQQIESSPILMCGMSMLHSLLLQSEESEGWYAALVAFAKKRISAAVRKKRHKAALPIWILPCPTVAVLSYLKYSKM